MQSKVEADPCGYDSVIQLKQDFDTVISNCKAYNKAETAGGDVFTEAANALDEWASELFEAVLDTGDTPSVKRTRRSSGRRGSAAGGSSGRR